MRVTKDTQVRGYLNKMGLQVSKEAMKEFHKYFSTHMKLIVDELRDMKVKRISAIDMAKVFEKFYGNGSNFNR